MKTKIEKEKRYYSRNFLFKLTITVPNIAAGKDHVFYFKKLELKELVEQINNLEN